MNKDEVVRRRIAMRVDARDEEANRGGRIWGVRGFARTEDEAKGVLLLFH